jgi:hypothetical protein
MPDYDFKVLSPIDFETLVRDLLQKELQLTLESFKSGADQGIDLRYVSIRRNQLVIQCKHYAESTFRALLGHLKNDELEKVKKLSPERYIFATSVPLSPSRKDKILTLFDPFIHTPGDIYGRSDLNNLLGRFPEIEKQTFKLWFSSTAVFEEMLRTRINNVSRETLAKIQRDAKVYVENGSFREALGILERLNVCLIVGVPGIGKTMLAEMLLLHYYSLGYEVIKVQGDISEASEVDYAKKRRMFYYDDFLGITSASDKFNKNEDQKLLDFISAMKHSEVSKLILTTREYILNQARMVYEKLDRTRFDTQTCIVDLSKYTRLNRAKILYNHIYFSDLPLQHRASLLENKSYLRIIDHPNYNPRIIEYVTDYSRLSGIDGRIYADYFVANLDNPADLWRHAFESQLSQESRDLLFVLLSLPADVFLVDLETAFNSYRRECASAMGITLKRNDFSRALKELDGNFVATNRSLEKLMVRFHNPSVRDFLENYVTSSLEELRLLVRSGVCFDQIRWLWEHQDSRNNSYPFRSKIVEHLEGEFVERLKSIFDLPAFHLANYWSGGKEYKGRQQVSFEQRIALVISAAAEIQNGTVKKLLDRSLTQLSERINAGTPDKDDLIHILENLEAEDLVTSEQLNELLASAKERVLSNIDWISEYRPYVRFIESFPDAVSSDERSANADAFSELARRNIFDELTENDPDTLRMYASEIKDIAGDLGVDVSELLKDVESRARHIEEDAEEPPKDLIDSDPLPRRDWCSDKEIESFFEGL